MNYILSTQANNYDMVKYENSISPDYALFLEGKPLDDLDMPLIYILSKKSDLNKLKKLHILTSSGPDLVSNALRKIIEEIAPSDVNFFDAIITFEGEKIQGFSAINLKYKINCIDMEKSEFKPTNFDPVHPTYRFYYMVLDGADLGANIVRCKEMGRTVVVSEKFKEACKAANLKGLSFSQALDLTYNNRTISEII